MKQMSLTVCQVGGLTIQKRIISRDFKTQQFDYIYLVNYILRTKTAAKKS